VPVTPEERERMEEVFTRIAVEQNPAAFDQLVRELNKLLELEHTPLAESKRYPTREPSARLK
jgi:hypothetical protein